MRATRVEAVSGWNWITEGWRGFSNSPGMWIVLVLVWFVLVVVLSVIPLIGGLVLALISPGLIGGMLYAARESLDGRELRVEHLFEGLRDPETRNRLLLLGAITLGFSLLMGIMAVAFVGGSMAMLDPAQAGQVPGMGLGGLFGLLVMLALSLLLGMAMFFAVPLVMFTDTAPLEALKASLSASIVNIPALLVFGVVYLVLAFVAAIPMMLGYLVLMPVTIAAAFRAYADVFPDGTSDPAAD